MKDPILVCCCGFRGIQKEYDRHIAVVQEPYYKHLVKEIIDLVPLEPAGGDHDGPNPYEARVHTGSSVHLD